MLECCCCLLRSVCLLIKMQVGKITDPNLQISLLLQYESNSVGTMQRRFGTMAIHVQF